MSKNVKRALGLALLMILVVRVGSAQEKIVEGKVSEDKRQAYEAVMDSVQALKAELMDAHAQAVLSEPLMDSGLRFLEIRKAGSDTLALKALRLTLDERQAYVALESLYATYQDSLKSVAKKLMEERVGFEAYNVIRREEREGLAEGI